MMIQKARKPADIRFLPLEEADIEAVYTFQNGECMEDLAWFFDSDDIWLPMPKKHIAEKIEKIQNEDLQNILGIWVDDRFVGICSLFSNWDPVCPSFAIIIWPEFRRQGIGTAVAHIMMDRVFNQYHGHMISDGVSESNEAGQEFMKKLGMKPCGSIRRVAVKDGKYIDHVCFDLLKPEYLAGMRGVRKRTG